MRFPFPLLLLAACGDKDGGGGGGDDTGPIDTGEELFLTALPGAGSYDIACGDFTCYNELDVQYAGVFLSVAADDREAPEVSNGGAFTEEGVLRRASIMGALQGQTLESTYGCADCGIGNTWAEFDLGDLPWKVAWEVGNPPSELADLDRFIQDLIGALRSCTDTADIELLPDCEEAW